MRLADAWGNRRLGHLSTGLTGEHGASVRRGHLRLQAQLLCAGEFKVAV